MSVHCFPKRPSECWSIGCGNDVSEPGAIYCARCHEELAAMRREEEAREVVSQNVRDIREQRRLARVRRWRDRALAVLAFTLLILAALVSR